MSSSSAEPSPKRRLTLPSSNGEQTGKQKLMTTPIASLNHISIAVNQKQEEQDQPFVNINYSPNLNFNGRSHTRHFPPGYRFCPIDGELIAYYLQDKVNNKELQHNGIKDVKLYDHNPAELTAQYPALGDKYWYFFTPRDRKYPNGERPSRAAGDGYWKATGADKPVKYINQVVGQKKALVYYEGKPGNNRMSKKTNWIMHEFRIEGPPRVKESKHDMKLDDWVLCRIYKKEKDEKGAVQGQAPGQGKKDGVHEAQHKPVSVQVSGPATALLEGSVSSVNDNYDLVGESSKTGQYSMDYEFLQYCNTFAANSDPQPSTGYVAWPLGTRAPFGHLDNKYFQDDSDDFDTDGLFAQNPNPEGQNSDNVHA